MSWLELLQWLGPHRTQYKDKKEVPLFSPAEWPPGAERLKKDVLRIHFGVLDFDKLSLERFEELKLRGAFYFYTTWSNAEAAKKNQWAARLVVPFSRPVSMLEWPKVWQKLNATFGSMADPACKDASRFYFLPSAPKQEECLVEIGEGEAFDVETRPVEVQAEGRQVTRLELEDFAGSLQRKKSEHLRNMGVRLSKILAGHVFADIGERDDVIHKLSCILVERWPDANPKTLAGHFASSLAVMAEQDDAPTLEDVEAKIHRHWVFLGEEREKRKSESFTRGRTEPYSDEELARWAEEAGVTTAGFKRRWLIQYKSAYYVFRDGTYSAAMNREALVPFCRIALAPAPVELEKMTKNGVRSKTVDDLMYDYGTGVEGVRVTMTQSSRYDNKTNTFIERILPLRVLKGEENKAVGEWLYLLAGNEIESLLDWISVVTRLDEPAAALYLYGAPGIGKSLLALGLGRLWSEKGPTIYHTISGNFNEGLERCPLILADEGLRSKDTRSLRELIQARHHTLNRKYQPTVPVDGSVRIILAANHMQMVASDENLTRHDIAAIIDRILFIPGQDKAAIFLKEQSTHQWMHDDVIAKHALWLKETREVKQTGRFLVSGHHSPEFLSRLMTQGGVRSAICSWLTDFWCRPERFNATGSKQIRWQGGKLLVSSRGLFDFWDVYKTGVRQPDRRTIADALDAISSGLKIRLRDGNRGVDGYWDVSLIYLREWAEQNLVDLPIPGDASPGG